MEYDITKVVGQCIRDYREANKLSKNDLANLINKSRVTIGKYESGEINIDIATLYQITEVLGLELSHLINTATAQIYNMEINQKLSSSKEVVMTYFLYYYDGRKNELSKSFILLSPTADDGSYDVSLFYIVKDLGSARRTARFSIRAQPSNRPII
jgi:transcriptional regulator with XRE-family HTH domain